MITLLFVMALSYNSHAQTDLNSAIQDGINQQNNAAQDIHEHLAANEAPATVNTAEGSVNATKAPGAAPVADVTPTPNDSRTTASAAKQAAAEDKDFSVKLHPTGKAVAAHYFQVAYQEDQARKAQERAQRAKEKAAKRLAAKARKAERAKLAKAAKMNKLKKGSKSSRAVASVGSAHKVKKSKKTIRTAQALEAKN